MKSRHIAAAAAALAVTAPGLLLLPAPAFADTGPAEKVTADVPTYAALEKAAEDTEKAHDEALAAKEDGRKTLEDTLAELDEDSHPLRAAALAADKAAEEAAKAKSDADKAVEDAEAALEGATDEAGKAEARKELETAEAAAKKAAEDGKKADAEKETAWDAWHDARVEALRTWNGVVTAEERTRKAEEEAAKALAARKECVRVPGLTALAEGLPSKIAAGTTTDFTVRVTNGTDRTLTVDPLVMMVMKDREKQDRMKVQWSRGTGWNALDPEGNHHLGSIGAVKPGDRRDITVRVSVDAEAVAGEGFTLLAADASDAYNPCVLGPMKRYDFQVLAAGSDPGDVEDAEPEEADDEDRPAAGQQPDPSPSVQGGTKTTAERGGNTPEGNLAETGSPSVLPQLAVAGGAAVALGAGVFTVVRRRRTHAG